MAQADLFPGQPNKGSIIGGKYRLLRMISEGGGGIVWEAADPDGRAIALKFLKWSPLKSRKVSAERFKNEFAILKSLAHPHISQIYDFGFEPASELYFFTSELLTEGDLKEMIGAPIPRIEELLLQALRALEYLRGHKLLHLDIKPQNLLLREDGEHPLLAMIDFGLATFRPSNKPGGTANYMPPELIVRRLELAEQIAAYPPPDHRSDLYSLGVTFYYILTGIQPFCCLTADGKRVDALATFRRHIEFDPPPPSAHRPEIPAYLDRIIMKLMARNPDDRYPSAIVAAQALQYSSPAAHAPESAATLLAYLPKEGKLIGRHRERAIIEEAIRAVAEGTPHAAPIICIAGGRGVGRSRLLASAKPFAQQLEMEVAEVSDAGLAEVLGRADRSRAKAHLLLMDDLDRALEDEAALESLRTLVRRLRLQQRLPAAAGPRLFFLFTVSADRGDVKAAALELGLDASLCRTVDLKNFTTAEVAEYLSTLLGESPDASVVDELQRCTDGNPLFITEHLEAMIAKGRLFSLAGRPDAKTLKTIGVDFVHAPPPRSLAESIREKLRGLPEEARALALSLACFGRPASAEELREASAMKAASRDLLQLVPAGLVRRGNADGRFAFTNALSARIIRDGADPALRAKAHDQIARVLQKHRAKPAELDLHLAYGSDDTTRIPALIRIAERAMGEHEPQLAAEHLEELLQLLPPADLSARADALVKLGAACERARRWGEAQEAYRRLGRLKAGGTIRTQLGVRSLEQMGNLALKRRNLKQARRHFEEAIALLKDEPEMLAWRVKLENSLAGVDQRDGRFEEAVARFERTAAVAEKRLSKAEQLLITNNELGEALLRSGDPRRALPILRKELEKAERSASHERAANLHFILGDALRYEEIHRLSESLAHYRKGMKLARTHRMAELEVRLHHGLGNLHLKMGKPDQALAHYREGLGLAQQIEGETTSVELMIGMGLAAQQMGKPDLTIEYFEAALEFASGPKGESAGVIRRYRPTIVVSLGDAYYQKGNLERAEEYLDEALALDRKQTLAPSIRYSLYGTCAEIALARGDAAAARRILPTLEAIAKAFPPAQGHLKQLKSRL